MRKNKTWTVELFDYSSVLGSFNVQQGQNDEFWTNDTEAYLNFKPNNDSFEFTEAELTMYNKNDGSLVVLDSTDGVMVENNVVSYEMQPEIIAHFGKWTVQVRFIRADNESFTSGIIEYEVKRTLGDAIPERLSAMKNWDTFFTHAQVTIDLIGGAELARQEEEGRREVKFWEWLEYAYSLNPGDGSGVDLSSYATKNYVDTAVSNVPIPDLSNYALKSHTHSEYALSSALANYVTNNQAQSTYATKEELANAQLGGDVDLTGYATENFVNNAINNIPLPDLSDYSKIGHTHSEYALKSQIKTDVPVGAKFTDTTYTAGTGINISGDVISATGGGGDGYDDTSVVNHMNDQTNPHDVTRSQVGLGNVDNTSDIDKPVSSAVQSALDNKADSSQVLTDVPANAKFTDTTYTAGTGIDISDTIISANNSELHEHVNNTNIHREVIASDTPPSDTNVIWVDTNHDGFDYVEKSEYIPTVIKTQAEYDSLVPDSNTLYYILED